MAQLATILTAFELDEITLKKIEDYFVHKENRPLDFKVYVDESLIGGFVVTIDDKVYDASALANINAFKEQIRNN